MSNKFELEYLRDVDIYSELEKKPIELPERPWNDEIKREIRYLRTQMSMEQPLHQFVNESIDKLQNFGYPKEIIYEITEQFKKAADKRRLLPSDPEYLYKKDKLERVKKGIVSEDIGDEELLAFCIENDISVFRFTESGIVEHK